MRKPSKSRGEYYCVVRYEDGGVAWCGPFRTVERAEKEFSVLNYDLTDVGFGKSNIVAWRVVRKGERKTTPWQPVEP